MTLILAVHGTRCEAGTATSRALARTVADRVDVPVQLGWVDIHTPTLTDTLRSVGKAVVVPVFLTGGYHVGSDIPAAIAAAGSLATATPAVGADVLPAVLDRLRAVGDFDAVVLAGAGSKRRSAVAEVHNVADKLARAVDRPARAGFVTASDPTVPDAVAALRRAGHDRVVIAPYLLAPGLFSRRLHTAGADAVSEPIGVHPLLVDVICRRWRQAEPAQPASNAAAIGQ